MKKIIKTLAFAWLLTISLPLMAQRGELVLASVTYDFVHVNDLNSPGNPVKEEMTLSLGETSSIYKHASGVKQPRKVVPVVSGPTIVVTGGPLLIVRGPGLTEEELFQYPKTGKLNIAATLGIQHYVVETNLPQIDWVVSKETRQIDKYTCQKAVGIYAGRRYTAWFAPELPFSNGPWKLSGLPGLILEAKDEKDEVMFLFKEVSRDTEQEVVAPSGEKIIKVSEKAFVKAKEAFDENPAVAMQSQLPVGAPVVKLAYRDGSGNAAMGDEARVLIEKNKKAARERKYNPIELK